MPNDSKQSLHPTDTSLLKASMRTYLLEEGANHPCLLVLPGGGYGMVSYHEGPPVAAWLNSIGISAVVLDYTVSSGDSPIFPEPQQQALYAMRWIRAHADTLRVDPARIGVIGFSAGGHLAACVSNGFDTPEWLLDPDQSLAEISARPDATILAYPVISSGSIAHGGSFDNLLGKNATQSERSKLSWETHVHPQCPPNFIWHTAEDTAVPVENSYLMAMALQQQKIPHELHVFPKGAHGLGLCSIGDKRFEHTNQWRFLAERWLLSIGF